MKQRLIIILTLLCLSLRMLAGIYTPDNLPMPYLQDERRHTINPDNILSPDAVARIDSLLYRAEHDHGVQALCIVVEQVEEGDTFGFGMGLAQKYKIGSSKQNTGLLFILSTIDRSYYILTGDGLEGLLPDAICKRIENHYMLPYLKESDWDKAMVEAVNATCAYFDGDETLKREEEDEDTEALIAFVVMMLVGIFGFGAIIFSQIYAKIKCPKCGKHTLKQQSKILISKNKNMKKYQVTCLCTACGHLVQRIETEYEDNSNGVVFLGGGGRSGFGGGGFSGGSFGGGHFSGGGAGGRF